MSLTKDRIIRSLCTSNDIPKSDAAQVLETLLETLKIALQKGEDVLISAHPETNVFGLALSAISFWLSAKGIKNKVLADC